MNKITAALVSTGLVSVASVAQANTVIYLTGSTAARAYIYSMMTGTSDLFSSPASVVAGTNANSSNQIVYEGTITGVSGTVDISCDFTGSEAGIASTAGQPLSQDIPNDPNQTGSGADLSTYPLPGVGAASAFFQPNGSGGWTAASSLPGGTLPDLSMADTSQAVSRTPQSSFPLHDYGVVGIVPFTAMKGYEATPDSSWNDCVNITTAGLNQALALGGFLTANYLTGNPNDSDAVAVVGRNFGSGTRVNTFLNAAAYPLLTTVGQYGWNSGYPVTGGVGAQGTLTFAGLNGSGTGSGATFATVSTPYASGGTIVSVGNDGYDSGGGVGQNMNVDGTGSGVLTVGYLGISDAQKAITDGNGGTAGGDGVPLMFNGVYESDANVENGSFPWWGQEHLLGQQSEFTGGTVQATVGGDLASAIKTYIGTKGTATGDILSNAAGQSLLVPQSKMSVSRSLDYGYPVQ
ncbi:MAG TPA: hypothetical protein VGJ73_00755 [Verrucomicrobiae bacterium]